jgi:autotransporter family porin
MNAVYRVVWSAVVQGWVVASELVKSCKKRGGKAAKRAAVLAGMLAAGAACGLPVAVSAQTDVTIARNWDIDNNHQVGSTLVAGGGTVNLTGTATFANQTAGSSMINITSAIAQGYATSPVDLSNQRQLNAAGKSGTISFRDPITGNMQSVPVYTSGDLTTVPLGTASPSDLVTVYSSSASTPYLDLRLATVRNGTLNVDLGNTVMNLGALKQSSLVMVDGTKGTQAAAVWNSANTFMATSSYMSQATVAQLSPYDKVYSGVAYNGTFSVTDRNNTTTSHTVTDDASLQQYNAWLVSQVQAGLVPAAQYDATLKLAYSSQDISVTVNPIGVGNTLNSDDPRLLSVGQRVLMQASGANAIATIANPQGTTVTLSQTTALLGTAGGTVVNEGRIGQRNDQAVAFNVQSGAKGINNGVVTMGYSSTDASASVQGGVGDRGPGSVYFAGANVVDGAGSVLTNNGIINLGAVTYDTRALNFPAVKAVNKGTFVNNGAMNIGVNDSNMFAQVEGVWVAGGSATNSATGTIYVGRQASSDLSGGSLAAGGPDTTIGQGGAAMLIASGGGSIDNQGRIVIGSGMQNSAAILVNSANGAAANVVNSGQIDVNGARAGSPLQNYGILVTAANPGSVTNAGTINLNGRNGIGIKATGGGVVTDSGTINVAAVPNDDARLANYGAWAEGAGSRIDIAGGQVNLAGDSAIGVHARNGGKISVSGGAVNFQSGAQQVGFFAYGKGSSVDINSAPADGLDVQTAGSTLFRIEDGAKVNNNAGARLIASGAGSTALQVTGIGSTANLDSMDITVSGDGATALKVEGGANGQMSGAAKLTLKDGATAVVVDNNKYDLSGNAVDSAKSTFTNKAAVNVADAKDVTAFVVKNGATLTNTGDIHLADGTAIEIVGAGSSVAADASGKRGAITVDNGTAGIYVHGGATLSTADTITVNNGATGVLVGSDAGKVTIAKDAHITGKGEAYGNLITNRSGAGNVLVDGATLEMQGSGAALLSENNLDSASHGHVIVSSETGGKGIALSKADGSLSAGSLTVGPNWQIDVTGNGAGVYANTTGDLKLDGTTINVSGAGNGVKADAAATVTIGNGTTVSATNRDAVLVTGDPAVLVNEGTLAAVDADATAVHLGDGQHAFANVNGGAITGNVELGNGGNTALLENSTLNGTLAGGAATIR